MTMASILDSHFFHDLKPLEKLYQKPLRIHLKRINNLEIYWDYWATNTTATFIILFLMVGTSLLVTIAIRLPCIYSSILRFAARQVLRLQPWSRRCPARSRLHPRVSSAAETEPTRAVSKGRGFVTVEKGHLFFSYGVGGGWFIVVFDAYFFEVEHYNL